MDKGWRPALVNVRSLVRLDKAEGLARRISFFRLGIMASVQKIAAPARMGYKSVMRIGIPFDTHAYVKKLVAAGISEHQAEVHTEMMAEVVVERLVTKEDLAALREDLKPLLSREELRADLKDLELRLTLRFGAMLAVSVAIVAALVKLL